MLAEVTQLTSCLDRWRPCHTGPSPSGFLLGLPDGSALMPALLDTGDDSCCQPQPGLQAPDCHSTESYGKERLTLSWESRRQAGSCCVIQVLFRPRQVPHYRGSLQPPQWTPPTVLCALRPTVYVHACVVCAHASPLPASHSFYPLSPSPALWRRHFTPSLCRFQPNQRGNSSVMEERRKMAGQGARSFILPPSLCLPL